MKFAQCLQGAILVSGLMFVGAAMAEGDAAAGEKIYNRAFGRGCGTCHDMASNPNLFESVKKMSRDDFKGVLVNGRNNMPKAMETIMGLPNVKSAGLSEDQAVDALIAFLQKGK